MNQLKSCLKFVSWPIIIVRNTYQTLGISVTPDANYVDVILSNFRQAAIKEKGKNTVKICKSLLIELKMFREQLADGSQLPF